VRLPVSHNPRRIERHAARLGPWYTQFAVDGRTYGGAVCFDEDWRIAQFESAFPAARTILEPGSCEGGQSFVLARRPSLHIVALEGRRANIARARYAQRLLGVANVRFIHVDLEATRLRAFGRFDAVLCSGLLYHLPRPWELLDQLREVSDNVYIWTHYAAEDRVETVIEGMPGHWYSELGIADPLSGLSPRSFWVTRDALVERLHRGGFDRVEIIQDDRSGHPNGPCVSVAARAATARPATEAGAAPAARPASAPRTG